MSIFFYFCKLFSFPNIYRSWELPAAASRNFVDSKPISVDLRELGQPIQVLEVKSMYSGAVKTGSINLLQF